MIEEWRYTAFVANTEPDLFADELTKHEPWVLYDCLDLWNRIVAAANKSPEEFVDAHHGDAFRGYVQVTRDMIIQELARRGLPVLGLESRRFNEEPRN
ncbi:MAG: hypothetical protein BGO81_11050 [Devosia sp. 66-22]|nr:MAG: hypothetical protein BGO81_11050 [Devosia sp. 66-22]